MMNNLRRERRRERRLKVAVPIKIMNKDDIVSIYSENISRLGTYAEVEQEIPIGTKVEMAIEIPSYTQDLSLVGQIKCLGDVFRCTLIRETSDKKIYGLGVFFIEFSDADRDKLSKYIDYLSLKEQEEIKQAMQRWKEKRSRHQG